MFVFVKFTVNIGVFESEISAEIENPRAGGEKWLGKLRCETMG